MYRPNRVHLLSLTLALIAGCGGAPSSGSSACSSDQQCRPDARCSSGGCVANTPPVAEFAITGELEASALVTLDGSASRDEDRDDAITSYLWRIQPDGAPCDGPAVSSTDRVVQVRFGCAGQFRAELIVLDGKHVQSTPATRALDIAPSTASPMVQAGPDQTVDHVCSGSPVTCRLRGAVQLTASTTVTAPLTFHWTVQAPSGRPLDAHRRVRFVPDASAKDPTVEIETDGSAIAGDWQFRVEVKDGVGVLDADVTRVSVTNHPPVIRGGPSRPFPHTFDASGRVFTSGGSIPVQVTDEDGDPVVRQLAFHHTGDEGGAFVGEDLGTAIRFTIAVPYDVPADALHLRAGAGLERSIALTATDVNDATVKAAYRVEIDDQPPVLVGAGETWATHSYDPTAMMYRSQPVIGRWADPDGDPLAFAVTADAECSTFTVQGGTVRVACARPFTSTASLPAFLRERKASVTVADPWAAITDPVAFRIGNTAPVASPRSLAPSVDCRRPSQTCKGTGSGMDWSYFLPATVLSVPSGTADPDGDPLEVKSGSNGPVTQCGSGQACSFTVLMPAAEWCGSEAPKLQAQFTATDGAETVSGSVPIAPACR